MGATPKRNNDYTYYSIVNGKFATAATPETSGAVKRHSEKKGKDVYELIFDDIFGVIKECYVESKDFGDGKKVKQLVIKLDDIGRVDVANIPVESKYFDHFCSKIGSADLKKDIKLAPYNFTDKEGKKVVGMNLWQGDTKMGYHFSKTDPKGCPIPGDEKMSESDYKIFKIKQREFFENYINSLGLGKGKGVTATPSHAPEHIRTQGTSPEVEEAPFSDGIDNLPF